MNMEQKSSHVTASAQNSEPLVAMRPEPVIDSGRRRPTPAITHFAVLAAFILPITLLPYLMTRRQLSTLRKAVDEVGLSTSASRLELNSFSEMAVRREEHISMNVALDEMKRELKGLRLQAERRDHAHGISDTLVRHDIRSLLNERQHIR